MLSNLEITNAKNECRIDENFEMDVLELGKIESEISTFGSINSR